MFHQDHKNESEKALLNRRFTLPGTKMVCQQLTGVKEYDIDVCAEELSHLAPKYYDLDARGENGLILPWHGHVWCNPPWDDLWSWTVRCWEMWKRGACDSISFLIPVRCEQPFWQQLVEPYRDRPGSPLKVYFLPKRHEFGSPSDPKKLKKGSPPFICCLLHWSKPK